MWFGDGVGREVVSHTYLLLAMEDDYDEQGMLSKPWVGMISLLSTMGSYATKLKAEACPPWPPLSSRLRLLSTTLLNHLSVPPPPRVRLVPALALCECGSRKKKFPHSTTATYLTCFLRLSYRVTKSGTWK